MRSPKLKTFTLFILAVLLSCGCHKAVERIECVERDTKTGMPIAARQTFQSGLVNYRGVSFTFSQSIQAEVVAETRCAVPFDEQGKGLFNEYHPRHRAFVFNGTYASQHADSFFEPEIRIYPAAEYRALIEKSKELKTIIDKEFEQLGETLIKQPHSFAVEAPFAAVLESGQSFQSRVKYINFRGGKGILYLTFFCREFTGCLIENQALSYIFQGLSDDGRYFIHATFPVKTEFLLKTPDRPNEAELAIHNKKTAEEIDSEYRKYAQRMALELEKLAPTSFEPSLTLFEDLLRSLSIAN